MGFNIYNIIRCTWRKDKSQVFNKTIIYLHAHRNLKILSRKSIIVSW